MGYVVRMPQLGMSMEEGTVVEWCLAEGATVVAGDRLAVIESEKASADVDAREDGVLRRIVVSEGETVEPGAPIAVVAAAEEDISDLLVDEEQAEAASPSSPADTDPATAPLETDADVRATPGARRRAADSGVALASVEGTGPDGVITEDDVAAALDEQEDGSVATRTVRESRPLSGMQQTIADRLGRSDRETVRVTVNRSFDAGTLQGVRRAASSADLDVSIEDLVLVAVRSALTEQPAFNAIFEEGTHQLVDEINLGIAVDVENGLVTPVLADVAELSIEELSSRRRTAVETVRSGSFTADDLAGATFTVSNLGGYGVDHFDPVIDPPQVAILGIGRIDEADRMTVSLSFDHRIVNGADAARFLASLVDVVTDADRLRASFATPIEAAAGRMDETRSVTVTNRAGLTGDYRVAGLPGQVGFDEPVEAGGSGTAPTPVEHLLGALGSCLSLSTRLMADRDGVALASITTAVDGSPTSGPLESVAVTLTLETDAAADEIDRLVTKAERACYVERVLAADLDVTVTWERTG